MVKEDLKILLYWQGSAEDKFRLLSEYRMLELKIQDTLDYLDKLVEEQEQIELELFDNIEIRKKE